ncbi:MAG: polyphosphate polymerase domain-containing protein [Defluviitaleaceae bacterium]|nr:polyphosphate polymerase domain-containing protein [Defluviitaleaceae bacterium]
MYEKNDFRFENKYFISEKEMIILENRLKNIMSLDKNLNGKYSIESLYFDDQYNTAFNEKMNGISIRSKFRARFYNGNKDFSNLEIKHKNGHYVAKKRVFLTKDELSLIAAKNYSFMKNRLENEVFKNFYSIHTKKNIRPVVNVVYDRTAYTYKSGNVRITFDKNLRAAKPNSNIFYNVFPEGPKVNPIILEVKYNNFIPSVISELLGGIIISNRTSISKFCLCLLKLEGGI